MFKVKSVDEVVSVLLPLTPQKVRELLQLTFAKPRKLVPTWFLKDFIQVSDFSHAKFVTTYKLYAPLNLRAIR